MGLRTYDTLGKPYYQHRCRTQLAAVRQLLHTIAQLIGEGSHAAKYVHVLVNPLI